MSEQTLAYKAEEHGQSRELKSQEVWAFALLSIVKAGAVAIAVAMLIIAVQLFSQDTLNLMATLVIIVGVGVIQLAVFVLGDLDTLVDGLRQWRSVESYIPAPAKQAETPWRPPVPIMRQGQPTALIDMNERPQLPGRQEALAITPPVVAELLKASLEVYNGEWSRRKLMRLHIAGQRVTRGMYEEITGALARAGILQQTRQGGFVLNAESFDDLRTRLPSLPAPGGMGGGPGRDGNGGGEDSPPPGRGMETLAERHRLARLAELDHEVRCYLKRKGGGNG